MASDERRTPPPATGSIGHDCRDAPDRRSTRSSHRGRHRRPHRAGTGRRAGCGTRPGSSHRRRTASPRRAPPSTTRGMRMCHTMFHSAVADARVDRDQRQVIEQRERHPPPRRPGRADRRAEHDRCEQDRRRAEVPAKSPRYATPVSPAATGRPALTSAADADDGHAAAISPLRSRRRRPPEEVDDARAPTGRDVVVHLDDVAGLHGGRCRVPAGAGGDGLERLATALGVGEEDQVGVGRRR